MSVRTREQRPKVRRNCVEMHRCHALWPHESVNGFRLFSAFGVFGRSCGSSVSNTGRHDECSQATLAYLSGSRSNRGPQPLQHNQYRRPR